MSRNEASKAEVCLILGNQYSPLGSHLAERKAIGSEPCITDCRIQNKTAWLLEDLY